MMRAPELTAMNNFPVEVLQVYLQVALVGEITYNSIVIRREEPLPIGVSVVFGRKGHQSWGVSNQVENWTLNVLSIKEEWLKDFTRLGSGRKRGQKPCSLAF